MLPESWRYFRVYDGCQPTYSDGICLGISAQEIAAKMDNEGITGKRRKAISRGVEQMSKAMAHYANSKRKG